MRFSLLSLPTRIALAALLFSPQLVFGQQDGQGQIGGSANLPLYGTIEELIGKVCEVVGWVFTGAIILTIIFVLVAGIKYITGGSNPTKISEAHKHLIWAAVGFAVALVAYTAPFIIARAISPDGSGSLDNPCTF